MINGKELVEQEERGNREMNIEEWRPWRRINRNEERLNEVFQNLYGSPFLNFANFRIVRSGLRRSRLLSGHEGSGGGNGGGNSNVRRRSDEEKKRTEEGRLRFFSSSNTLQRQYSRLNGGEENEDSRESSIASGSSVKGSPPGFSASNNINTETDQINAEEQAKHRRSRLSEYRGPFMEDVLPYEIHSWSSYSAKYYPHNVLKKNPNDQESRWSSNGNDFRQFLMLKLEKPGLIRAIKFGKFYKTHVCNMKEFRVFAGMTPDSMVEILHSGLRNDEKEEVITTRQKIDGYYIPSLYVKIQPLVAYDQKFNFSIWSVELIGSIDPRIVQQVRQSAQEAYNDKMIRQSLDYLRSNQMQESFDMVLKQSKTEFEAPIVSRLYEAIVNEGDYETAERILITAHQEGMLDSKVISFAYQSIWEQVEAGEQNKPVPAGRGGHQMCIDDVRGKIYMYGGWDGKENMGDFWEFDIMEMQWRCLGIDNAPGKRSLHSMCFDSINNRLYVIGRYYDQEHRASTSLESDMYMYDVNENKWYLESANTERCNGPKMQYDAQMVFDELNQCIYLYGGKIIQPGSADTGTMYGGLYRYDTKSGEWTSLRADMHIYDHETQVTGRFFHSMTIDPRVQRLYIMSNYRDRTAAGDMFVYDIETDTFFERTRNMIAKSPPSILSSCRGSSSPICNIFGSRMSTKITGLNYMLSKKPLSTPCGIDGHADSCSAYKRWYTKNGYNLSSSEYNKPQLNPLQMAASASVQHNSYSLKITLDRSRNELYLLTSHGFEPTVHSNNEFYPISDLHSVDVSYDSSLLDTLPNHVRCPTQNHVSMSILTYQFEADAWQENYNSDFTIPDNRNPITPPPRYAQAMVYSERLACHFMFGGNSGVKSSSRLNDLWILRLRRPLSDSILRNSLFLIRAKKFLELCHLSSFTSCVNNNTNTNPSPSHSSSSTPSLSQISNIFVKDNTILSDQLLRKNIYQDQAMECLNFLRSKVSVLVDHENHAESAAYRALTNHLISKFGSTMIGTLDAFGGSVDNSLDAFSSFGSEPDFLRSNRRSLFDSLVENFFPEGSYNSKRNIVF